MGTTDYTIRMNYTTVPRTWVPVNKWKHHLSAHYKEYLSSGFLSIQVRAWQEKSSPIAPQALELDTPQLQGLVFAYWHRARTAVPEPELAISREMWDQFCGMCQLGFCSTP